MVLNLTQKKKSFTISITSEEGESSPIRGIIWERVENILLARTESPQRIFLAEVEWYKVSNILQDNHYFTTETKDHALCTTLWERGVDIQSDGKA